jgi:hypothetical protein
MLIVTSKEVIMDSSVENWPQPYYAAGGGDAFLFYVVYGSIPQDFSISRSEYRCDAVPPGMTCTHQGHVDDPDFNNVHVEIK